MRLKTLIAAAAMSIGLLAHADYADKAMSFESMTADEPATKATLEAEDSGVTWDLKGNTDVTVKAYAVGETKYLPRAQKFVADDTPQNNYLAIKTPLTNGIVRTAGATIDKAIYVDTLVKFTAADAEDDLDIPTDGKIAVWVKAMNEEGTENHIMISAGPVENNKPTTYDCGVINDLDAWHRLTIKVISDVTQGSSKNGLVVYLDAKSDSVDVLWSEDAKSAFEGVTLTDVAAEYKRNGQLFPAMQNSTTLASVEFAGQGAVDDIVYTETQPAFAADPMIYTIAWAEGVTAFDYTPYNGEKVSKTDLTEAGAEKIVWDGANKPTVENVAVVEGKTYAIDESVAGTTTIAVQDLVATGLIDGNEATFTSVEDMITAINGATSSASVSLRQDLTKGLALEAAVDVTIDLAGKNITAAAGDDAAIANNGSYALTVTNSLAAGGIVDGTAATGKNAVNNPSGYVYLQAGTYEGVVNGDDYTICSGGLYSAADNGDQDGCWLTPAQGKTFELQGEYFACVDAVTATATVIFICDKTGYNYQKTVTAGETFDETQTPTSADVVGSKTFYKVTAWKDGDGNAFATFTPEADATYTFYADLDINLTQVDDAYQVTSAADLVTLKDYVADGNNCAGKTFKQTANIDMKDAGLWKGIGNKAGTLYFGGIYDGNDKRIDNVTFDAQAGGSNSYMGFFRYVKNGTVKDLTIESDGFDNVPKFFGDATEYGGAVIVGIAENATLSGLTAEGNIGTAIDPTTHNAGGIAVEVFATTVENCVNKAALHCAYSKAAGIVVFVNPSQKKDTYSYDHGSVISGCSNEGGIFGYQCWTNTLGRCNEGDEGALKFKGVASDGFAGILAWVGDSTRAIALTNNVNTGSITADGGYIGGIIGKISYPIIGEGNSCAAALPIVATFFAAQGTDFWYETIDAGTATQDKTELAAGQTRVIAAGSGNSNANLPKPVLALALNENITFITNLCSTALNFTGITVASGAELKEEVVEGGVKFTAVAPAPVNPIIKPDGSTEAPVDQDTKEKAEAWAAANVKVESPDKDVVTTDAFTAYFKFTATGDAAPFTISAELIDDVVKAEDETEEALTQVLALTEDGSINLTNAKPGLMYALKQGNKLEAREATAAQMADKDGKVSLSAEKWADAGFYQILVTAPITNK